MTYDDWKCDPPDDWAPVCDGCGRDIPAGEQVTVAGGFVCRPCYRYEVEDLEEVRFDD